MDDQIPDILYHYCSVSTFYNIMKNQSIWLSDISKSNDSQELNWATEQFKEFYRYTWLRYVREVTKKKSLTEEESQKFDRIKTILDAYLCDDIYKYWVFCLSEKADDLGQWRGYADDGHGLAIGFDTEPFAAIDVEFADVNDSFDFCFRKIGYGEAALFEYFDMMTEQMEISAEIEPDAAISRILTSAKLMIDSASWFKNSGFKSEKEWRLIYKKLTVDLHNNKLPTFPDELSKLAKFFSFGSFGYIPKNNDLVSHIELKTTVMNKLVKEIIIGPKCLLTESEIQTFLISCGIIKSKAECEFIIKKSESTYR